MQIHTYGYIDSMFYTLNAFAMLVNSDLFAAIIKMLIVLGLASASIAGVRAGNFKAGISVLFTSIIVVNGMLVPKASIEIYDHVTKQHDKIDNLPLGFVLPVGIIESVGISIANKVDQVLQVPNKTYSYLEYGGTFGASMIQQSKNFRLQDPVLASHIEQFMERCVLMRAAIGEDFTESDIANSKNVWSEIIKPKMKDGIQEVSLGNKQMGCKTASQIIEKAFNETYNENFGLFKNTRFALSGRDAYSNRGALPNNMDAYFKKNLETVFGSYLNQNTSALDTIRQITLLHSFSRFGEYGALRAIQSAESNFDIIGKIAGYQIPMLLTIFKCICYIGFIFVIPVILITGSMDRFKKYLILICSFQVWPVISSILNMFVDLYSASSFIDLSRAGGISLSTISTIENTSDMIVAISSSLQMSVPVIAYAFISGGIDAISSFHGNITSAMNAGASLSSSEILSGNKSFDNEGIGNTNNFKTDRTSSYKSDSSLMEYADGSTMRQLTSGKEIYSGGSGITEHQTPFKFDLSSSMQSVAEDSLREQASVVEATSKAYTESKAKTIDETAEVMTSIDKHISSGDTLGLSQKLAQNKELSEAYNIAKQIQKETGSDFKTAAGVSLGKMFSASAEYGANSSDRYQDTSLKTNDIRDVANQLAEVSKDENIQKTLGLSEQSISKMNESASQTKSLENKVSQETQKQKSIESSASKLKSISMNAGVDKTKEVISEVAQSLGISERDAIKKMQSGDPLALKKTNEAQMNIANEEFSKLSEITFDSSSYTDKARGYNYGRERAPQFGELKDSGRGDSISSNVVDSNSGRDSSNTGGISGSNNTSYNSENRIEDLESRFNEDFKDKSIMKGVTANKVRANIESGRDEINTREIGLKERESSTSGEVAEKFKGGERDIDNDRVDREIRDRENSFEFTKEGREIIDGGLSKGKSVIGNKVIPDSVKKFYGNVKKAIVEKDTSSSENLNESAKQIKKDKK